MSYELWISPQTGYRRRGTRFADLRILFDEGLTVAAIAEPLQCALPHDRGVVLAQELVRLEFDICGLYDPDVEHVTGWIRREGLGEEPASVYLEQFASKELRSDSTPISEIIPALAVSERIFIVTRRAVSGIVTRADLRKPPVRILLFGLVSLLETHLTFWIRALFPNDAWQPVLKKSRIALAAELLAERTARNEEIDLVDCLQLCDKREILVGSADAREILGFASKTAGAKELRSVERLRDRLAHSQNEIVGPEGWDGLASDLSVIQSTLQHSDAALEARVAAGAPIPPQLVHVV